MSVVFMSIVLCSCTCLHCSNRLPLCSHQCFSVLYWRQVKWQLLNSSFVLDFFRSLSAFLQFLMLLFPDSSPSYFYTSKPKYFGLLNVTRDSSSFSFINILYSFRHHHIFFVLVLPQAHRTVWPHLALPHQGRFFFCTRPPLPFQPASVFLFFSSRDFSDFEPAYLWISNKIETIFDFISSYLMLILKWDGIPAHTSKPIYQLYVYNQSSSLCVR